MAIRGSLLIVWFLLMMAFVTACGGGTSNPNSPSTTPSPEVATPAPTQPTEAARILEFTPDTPTPVNEAIGITVASRGHEQGEIALAVTAFNLVNHSNLGGTPGVAGMYGRVKWDDSLLVQDAAGIGELMQQNGVTPGCCTPGEVVIEPQPGTFPFSVQRSPGTPLVSGSGEIVLLRLRPRDGVTSGTSRIDFVQIAPPIFPEVIRLRPFPTYPVPQHVHGGTIIIR